MSADGIVDLTDDTFDEVIQGTPHTILVDFWAPWCPPCRMVAPALEQLAQELTGIATIAKVNVDDNIELSGRYGIRHIPTLLIFKGGKRIDEIVGAAPKDQIRNVLRKHAATPA